MVFCDFLCVCVCGAVYIRAVAGGSAGSARADPKFWPNSTVLLSVLTLNFWLFLLVPTLTKILSYGPESSSSKNGGPNVNCKDLSHFHWD